ncbi:MAG: ester cyclase, partial [Actinobacteria bacterium]|nr:ester cyclase [Actinomycetota bacterium]
MSETTERNKGIVRRYQDAYNSNDLDVLDELLAPDWKTQAFPTDLMEQTIENVKAVHQSLLESFPDLHITTHELIAEGDVVVQSYTVRGTHRGDMA